MNQPSRVIGMQVRDHHLTHVARSDSQRPKLRPDLLLRVHRKSRRTPKERVPSGVITPLMYPRSLPGIHHNNSLGMIDHPSINRQPVRPPLVKQDMRRPRQSLPAPFDLGKFHLHQARTNGMNGGHRHFLHRLRRERRYVA